MKKLTLPLAASVLIPHRKTMLLVDKLLAYDATLGAGTVLAGSRLDTAFAVGAEKGEGALLEEVVLLEMMAQAYACLRGYEDRLAGRTPGLGFLVGVRHFHLHRQTGMNEKVMVEVTTTVQVDAFFMAEAIVKVALETVAEAELKIWVPPQDK